MIQEKKLGRKKDEQVTPRDTSPQKTTETEAFRAMSEVHPEMHMVTEFLSSLPDEVQSELVGALYELIRSMVDVE